jgi:hypothetical protein
VSYFLIIRGILITSIINVYEFCCTYIRTYKSFDSLSKNKNQYQLKFCTLDKYLVSKIQLW